MRYLLIGASTALTLVGAVAIGNAQTQDDKGKGPAAEDKGPAATQPGRAQAPQAEPRAPPRRGADAGGEHKKADPPQTMDRPKSSDGQQKAQGRTTDRAKSTESPKHDADLPKSAEPTPTGRSKEAEHPKQRKDRQATEPQAQDRPKSTEGPQRDQDRQKSTQDKGRDLTKSAEQPGQGERARVTELQRTTVRESLIKTRIEKTRIKMAANIGTAIPRSVRLRPLPVAIFVVAPEYRGYSYIVLEDETICIVDERTYLIVDVIPSGSERADRADRAELALSAEQMRFIFASVPRDGTTNVRVRLALGAEVPPDVELLAFPQDVLRRLPELERYRYIIAGSDSAVAIVDPDDNAVVLVINE
jgi:uncharacterized protein DUF1236